MSTLETLLAEHRLHLSTLYTTLTPNPLPELTLKLDQLVKSIQEIINTQLEQVQHSVDEVEKTLEAHWNKVIKWKTALGEDPLAQSRGDGPLLILLDQVGIILDSMQERIQHRGSMIMTLQSQLIQFRPILGPEWIKVPLPLSNNNEVQGTEVKWDDMDLTLERLSALEREIVRCENELTQRRAALATNINEIFTIRTELGIHQDLHAVSGLPSYSLESANVPASDPLDELILAHLGIGEGREKKDMLPTEENLLRVEAKRKWLQEEKDHRNTLIQTTYDKLHPLWTMLGVTDIEMEAFVEKWMGSTADVVNAYQTELKRMLTLKRSNLSAFILRERISLAALWDTLYLSPAQRLASFPAFSISVQPSLVWNAIKGADEEIVNDNVSEELLVAHEREREKWEEQVTRAGPVLERLEKYFTVVEEMRELEASASDPSRLLGKTTRGDPGRLLREEKARKRVVKEKPKLENELRKFIPTWEAENDRPFLVNGKRFLDDLDEKIEAEIAEKENKKRAKSGLSSATASSTASSSNRIVPLRSQNTGGAPLLRAQNTGAATAPLKRQNTGAPTKTPTSKRPATHQVVQPTGPAKLRDSQTSSHTVPISTAPPTTAETGHGGGMKIPTGWGGSATSPADLAPPANFVQPQYTGFRPSASTGSSTRLSGGNPHRSE